MNYSILAGVLELRDSTEHVSNLMTIPVTEIRRVEIRKTRLARVVGIVAGLCAILALVSFFNEWMSGLYGFLFLMTVSAYLGDLQDKLSRKVTIQTAYSTFHVIRPPQEARRMEEDIRAALAESLSRSAQASSHLELATVVHQ